MLKKNIATATYTEYIMVTHQKRTQINLNRQAKFRNLNIFNKNAFLTY